jgi:hypothetical protein
VYIDFGFDNLDLSLIYIVYTIGIIRVTGSYSQDKILFTKQSALAYYMFKPVPTSYTVLDTPPSVASSDEYFALSRLPVSSKSPPPVEVAA